MCHFGDDTKARSNQHGDDPNATSKLNSTSQIEVSTEENILQVEYSPLKYKRLDNDYL